MLIDDSIKHRIEIIEKVYDLHGRAFWRQGSKPNNIREVYGDSVIDLRFHLLTHL